jgi:hypothetical protein
VRPNPIGLHIVAPTGRRRGGIVDLDAIDVLDGTPVHRHQTLFRLDGRGFRRPDRRKRDA